MDRAVNFEPPILTATQYPGPPDLTYFQPCGHRGHRDEEAIEEAMFFLLTLRRSSCGYVYCR